MTETVTNWIRNDFLRIIGMEKRLINLNMDLFLEEVTTMIDKDYFSENLVDSIKEEIIICQEYVSQEILAERLNTSRETLCRKINNPCKMSLAELDMIAAALGKSLCICFK